MPRNNRFRHQAYRFDLRTSDPQVVRPSPPAAVGSNEFQQQLSVAAETFRDARVLAIFLLHGTFAGDDPLGMCGSLSRLWPQLGDRIRRAQKSAADRISGDIGNYSHEFAQILSAACHQAGANLQVERFCWGSANHHLARAEGAIQLIHTLHTRSFPPGSRIQLWGHSHGGNVLALVTNLLTADVASREQFFVAAESYSRSNATQSPVPLQATSPQAGLTELDRSAWPQVRQLLSKEGNPLSHLVLDLVTHGTPVIYGWDTDGYDHLLHFIHHVPVSETEPFRAGYPPAWDGIVKGAHGDLVQQLAVAGTNLPPTLFQWRMWLSNRRLHAFLQQDVTAPQARQALKQGFRIPDEGQVLLVDYGIRESNVLKHLFGHAVYTKIEWLPFHAGEIARRLYG